MKTKRAWLTAAISLKESEEMFCSWDFHWCCYNSYLQNISSQIMHEGNNSWKCI